MDPEEKDAGRFYCNFKVHKKHEPNKTPPERPITSQSATIGEGIATFVEHHIKHIATNHESYLQDTPDFLREIKKVNEGPKLSNNTILMTMDVSGLFTNIIHKDGMETTEEKLLERENKKVPTEYIMKLMEIILHNNIFEFHDSYWKQNIGAAMGSKPVPPYANIFMAKIDKMIKNQEGAEAIMTLKRFIDDFFIIFKCSTTDLHAVFAKINQIHPSIQLTMSHTSNKN